MRPIIIITPDYTPQSNGIKALHHICHLINNFGGVARVLFLTNDKIVGSGDHDAAMLNPDWNTPILQEHERHFIEDGIVLYPEVVNGNPMNAKRVARWVGNKEGVLRDGIGMSAEPSDFIVAHSRVLCAKPDHVLFYTDIPDIFNDDDSPPEKRILNATYIGKGYLYGDVGIIKNTLWIERKYPSTKPQLAFLLRHVACMYTWDSWSETNVDAILCGAVPYFLRYTPFTPEEVDASEIGVIPRLDDNNRTFNLSRFRAQRRDMIKRLNGLKSSWPVRVKEFYDKLQGRFE